MRCLVITVPVPDFIQGFVQGLLFCRIVVNTPLIRLLKPADTHTQQSDRGIQVFLQPFLQQYTGLFEYELGTRGWYREAAATGRRAEPGITYLYLDGACDQAFSP